MDEWQKLRKNHESGKIWNKPENQKLQNTKIGFLNYKIGRFTNVVKPIEISLNLEGKGPIISGRNTRFLCKSRGSRPAASIKWFLGHHEITPKMIRSNPFVIVEREEEEDEGSDLNVSNTESDDILNHVSKFVNKHMKKEMMHKSGNGTFYHPYLEQFGNFSQFTFTNSSQPKIVSEFRRSKTTISIMSMIPDPSDHGKHLTCRTFNPVLVNSYEVSSIEETIRLDVNCKSFFLFFSSSFFLFLSFPLPFFLSFSCAFPSNQISSN